MRLPFRFFSLLIPLLVASLLVACTPAAQPATGGDAAATPETAVEETSAVTETAATAEDSGEAATLSLSGAFALLPMASVWADEYTKLHPNVQFDIQGGGAGKGMTDVLNGAVDVAMVSREIRQEETDAGAVGVPVTIDAVVGVANAANPSLAELQATGLTPELVARIWLTDTAITWGEATGSDSTDPIHVYTRSDSAGAAEQWARYAGGTAQEELKGTGVNADPGLAEAVRQDPLGIGYNNIGFAYDPTTLAPLDGLAIIPLDLNGDGQISDDENFYASRDDLTAAIAAQVYPFPPARVLYFVTNGEPSGTVKDFYRWVLTDGQAFVGSAGYVNLTEDRIQAALEQVGE